MDVDKNRRHALLSWLFVGAVAALGVFLGVLQYRWIGEVGVAERDRLRAGLQTSLRRLGQDFNTEITAACSALLPPAGDGDEAAGYAQRYLHWKESSRHGRMFRQIGLVYERNGALSLLLLDRDDAAFAPAPWPASWQIVRDRMATRFSGEPGTRRFFGPPAEDTPDLIEMPMFPRPMFAPRERPERERERGWVIVQLDLDYVRSAMIPELVHRHLAGDGKLDYEVEIVPRENPSAPIYSSHPGTRIGARADAAAGMFELQRDQFMARRAPLMRAREGWRGNRGGGPGREPAGMDRGRWEILVRHRAGSLETLVASTRRRNMAVTVSVLLLMLAAVAALVRYTQRSQRLARLEMDFVAGVSHELRTPLSVIRTAAHNLAGGVVSNPRQVARYGGLIEQEAERLTGIVEQVLHFAGTQAGHTIGALEPVAVETLINEALAATRRTLEESRCTVERTVEPGLPPVLADPVLLKHALQNLLVNAAKYGAQGGWIGISASRSGQEGEPAVELRVTDRGPGIPHDELAQIFEPFYRGRRAVEDQIHGTGLGLNLVKRVIEAHHGTVTVASDPGRSTEFVLRIPTAAAEHEDEFADSTRRG